MHWGCFADYVLSNVSLPTHGDDTIEEKVDIKCPECRVLIVPVDNKNAPFHYAVRRMLNGSSVITAFRAIENTIPNTRLRTLLRGDRKRRRRVVPSNLENILYDTYEYNVTQVLDRLADPSNSIIVHDRISDWWSRRTVLRPTDISTSYLTVPRTRQRVYDEVPLWKILNSVISTAEIPVSLGGKRAFAKVCVGPGKYIVRELDEALTLLENGVVEEKRRYNAPTLEIEIRFMLHSNNPLYALETGRIAFRERRDYLMGPRARWAGDETVVYTKSTLGLGYVPDAQYKPYGEDDGSETDSSVDTESEKSESDSDVSDEEEV